MPWTHQWNIGYTDASGQWSRAHGYNGAFSGTATVFAPDNPPGKLAWINRHALRFYVDHTAGKGSLHLWDGDKKQAHLAELHGTGVRPIPLNAALKQTLCANIRLNITQVKSSPYRAAYALDDEASWGHFTHPTMWRVTDDANAYPAWLKEVYGAENAPAHSAWVSYEDIRPHLETWAIRDFDASPLMDQWSFNDSTWCNFLGGLVEYANSVDPATPCGIVGGQAPNAFGGYDYAKLMRKIQYIEAYDLGGSQALIRSFNPNHAVPAVTSMFHQSAADDIWQVWHGLAHGNRGHIGWVENWFDGQTPRAWHEQTAPHYKEAAAKIGPLLQGATWQHDGRRPVLQPRLRSTGMDTGRAGAWQNVDEPRRRSSPGRVASGATGVGKHAARQRPAIQSSQLCGRDTKRHSRRVPYPCPARLPVPVRGRSAGH